MGKFSKEELDIRNQAIIDKINNDLTWLDEADVWYSEHPGISDEFKKGAKSIIVSFKKAQYGLLHHLGHCKVGKEKNDN